jgi:hypothetical protein
MLAIPGLQSNLHDATLQEVVCMWDSQVSILMRTLHRQVRIKAIGFTALVVPREAPWGRSVSVNEVRLVKTGSNQVRLEIEMQSGDTITVAASQVEADEYIGINS